MAKKVNLEQCREIVRDGGRLPPGVCVDFDRYPEEFYACTDLDERVADGEISRSWDGTTVTNLATGKVSRAESTVVRRADEEFVESPGTVTGTANRTVTTEGAHP